MSTCRLVLYGACPAINPSSQPSVKFFGCSTKARSSREQALAAAGFQARNLLVQRNQAARTPICISRLEKGAMQRRSIGGGEPFDSPFGTWHAPYDAVQPPPGSAKPTCADPMVLCLDAAHMPATPTSPAGCRKPECCQKTRATAPNQSCGANSVAASNGCGRRQRRRLAPLCCKSLAGLLDEAAAQEQHAAGGGASAARSAQEQAGVLPERLPRRAALPDLQLYGGAGAAARPSPTPSAAEAPVAQSPTTASASAPASAAGAQQQVPAVRPPGAHVSPSQRPQGLPAARLQPPDRSGKGPGGGRGRAGAQAQHSSQQARSRMQRSLPADFAQAWAMLQRW
jgi:hypothetical protein